MKGRLAATLFGLPFLGIGLWMLWSIGSVLADVVAMRDRLPVEARLLEAGYHTRQGDDSTTYEAFARYAYEFEGRRYEGRRVAISGGADNIGDYQRELGSRLERAQLAGQGITVWVDPDSPAEAIIDRDPRWGLLAFKSMFVLVFGGFGGGLLWFTWRRSTASESVPADPDAPWLSRDEWESPVIRSGSRLEMWFAWGFAIFWNLLSAPLPFVAIDEIRDRENWLALLALVFPLVGIGLLVWAVRATRAWRRFGAAPVTLDPFPGAIGGHVGGRLEIRLPYDPAARFEASLTALSSYLSGNGKNRKRREKAVWQDTRLALAEPGGAGTRVVFRFEVPDDLPESDALRESDSYTLWRLNLRSELAGTDFDRDYDIPVYATGARSSGIEGDGLAAADAAHAKFAGRRILERFHFERTGAGARLFFPMGRHLSPALGGLAIGLAFSVAGYYIATAADSPIFGSVFGGVGGLVALACACALLNSLEVSVVNGELVSLRRVAGVRVRRRTLPRQDFAGFRSASTMQSRSGSRHTVYYTLYATDGAGREIVVGEGFRGHSEAETAARFVAREFSLPHAEEPAPESVGNPLASDL